MVALQRFFNRLQQTIKTSGEITASYTTLVDLGETFVYGHLIVTNGFDEPMTLKFTNTKDSSEHEFEIASGGAWGLDGFKHNGIVQFKYTSDAPTEGLLTVISW